MNIWLLGGISIGVLNGMILQRTVAHLRPQPSFTMALWLAMSFILRIGLATGLLIAALHPDLIRGGGILPGILAFIGLWLGRWIVVYLVLHPRSLFTRFRRS
jgi:hypothetical protein